MNEKRIPLAKLKAAWNDHTFTVKQVADSLGISPFTLRNRAIAFDLPERPRSHYSSKITKIDPVKLAHFWDSGARIVDIADYFKCSPPTVSKAAKKLELSYRGKGFNKKVA